MNAARLVLDHEGRYVQGPVLGKPAILQAAGAKKRTKPPSFPVGRGKQLVCVFVPGSHDRALWVQDDEDWIRCLKLADAAPDIVAWFSIDNAALFQADRLRRRRTTWEWPCA